jgi:hypothetical protein
MDQESASQMSSEYIKSIADDAKEGLILEVDLEDPDELHEEHNDYPLAPERLTVTNQMLSDKQIHIKRCYNTSDGDTLKLVPNLMNKRNYIVHYRLLKFYIEKGMILRKVHRVLKFSQSCWLRSYITDNSKRRAEAKSAFEKDYFKLLNNSVYGKTCENLKKRKDVKIVTTEVKLKKLVDKPHFIGFKKFNENCGAVHMKKLTLLIDKPSYVGFCVLELSKLLMYQFHYDTIKSMYGPKAELLFTDTDSLMYEIETEDVYEDFFKIKYDLALFIDLQNKRSDVLHLYTALTTTHTNPPLSDTGTSSTSLGSCAPRPSSTRPTTRSSAR